MFTLDQTARKRIVTGFAAALGTALMAFEAMPAQAAPPAHAPAWGYRRNHQNTEDRDNYRRRHTTKGGDIDGDGIPNSRDRDIDGDGIRNSRDRDVDGDGIRNGRDRYDHNANRWRRNSQGNWFLRRVRSNQVHNRAPYNVIGGGSSGRVRRGPGAGTGDLDRDGIPDRRDRDIDGDGVPNARDRYDRDPRRW